MSFNERTSQMPGHGVAIALALVIAAACLFGLNPIFAKLAFEDGLDPIGALVWRFGLPCLLLAPFWLRPRPAVPGTPLRRPILIALGAGAVMGLGMIAYFAALETLTVGTAAVIYFTYPAFTILIGLVAFKEAPTSQTLTACALVMVASGLVIGAPSVGPGDLSAVALCFAAPVAFAILLQALGRGLAAMTSLSRTGLLILGHLLVLVPFLMLQTDVRMLPTSATGWVGAVGLAFAASLLPQLLMAIGAPKIGATKTSLLGSFELITALVLGWALLGEAVSNWTLAGSVLVMAALYLTVRGSPADQ